MAAFLDAVNMASVTIILSVAVEIGKVAITDWRSIMIAVLGFIATYTLKNLNTAFIIFGGAALGWVLLQF